MKPNFVLVIVDDMGAGDLGAYGGRSIDAPELDRLARTGLVSDAMYAAAATDTPSRAGILLGRYGARYRLPDSHHPSDGPVLPASARTVAYLLKTAGYTCALFGQWRLGDRPGSVPLDHGFDEFSGTLYGPDVSPLTWYQGKSIVDDDFDPALAARRITDDAIRFLDAQGRAPFLLVLSHLGVGAPFTPDPLFAGRSDAGRYGDVIESIDHHLGRLIKHLRERGLARDTLVLVTSDNGPGYEGSNQGLRGRKPELMEGGVRVPFVASWPGRTRPRRDPTPRSLLDIVPSLLELAGVQPPDNLDGESMAGLLAGGDPTPRGPVFLFFNQWLNAVRSGRWKLHYAYGNDNQSRGPALYDVGIDTRESCSLTELNPDVTTDLSSRVEAVRSEVDAEAGLSMPVATNRAEGVSKR